jgi:hypothetical protein
MVVGWCPVAEMVVGWCPVAEMVVGWWLNGWTISLSAPGSRAGCRTDNWSSRALVYFIIFSQSTFLFLYIFFIFKYCAQHPLK